MAKRTEIQRRLSEANRDRYEGQKAFEASSAERLAVLKTLHPGRLARLRNDPELTEADQQELRNFIAGQTKRREPRAERRRHADRRRGYLVRRFGLKSAAVVCLTVIVCGALVYAWLQTPSEHVEVGNERLFFVELDGSTSSLEVPAGTILRDPVTREPLQRIEVEYWDPGQGYRQLLIRARQTLDRLKPINR